MKKFTMIIALYFLGILSIAASTNSTDECFDIAVKHLGEFEEALGFELNQTDATNFLNEEIMLCWCLDHIDYCLEAW